MKNHFDTKQAASAEELFQALLEIRLGKERVGPLLEQLKTYVHRLEGGRRLLADCEQRAGMSLSDLRKTLRQVRDSAVRRQALTRKLGLRVEELEKIAEQAAEAGRQLRQVETDAGMSEQLPRETARGNEDGARAWQRA